MSEFLIESALLTHGLKSITNDMLLEKWENEEKRIAWLEAWKIRIETIQNFCTFREKLRNFERINYQNFQCFQENRKTGIFTASGTMKACELLDIPLAVTCGMGGLMKGQKKEDCHDVAALSESSVSLIATAPKDMFDLKTTIDCMIAEGIKVYGYHTDFCDGYMFLGKKVTLTGIWKNESLNQGTLYLRGISYADRIADRRILEAAHIYGKEKEKEGFYYHPAVNEKIDELSKGKSSQIQLEALLKNIKWAKNFE